MTAPRPAVALGTRYLVLAVAALLAGCATLAPATVTVAGPDAVYIPPLPAAGARMPMIPIPALFKAPHGAGPFPAVIILHGCGGIGASQVIWAKRLLQWGYAALIPESFTPRGIKRVCEPEAQHLVTPRDRVGDVGSAAAWLRAQPRIDPDRIAVLGLSHGGATAAMTTEKAYADFHLRAAIDYYGPCVDPWAYGGVPLLVLAGAEDDWGHPGARCAAYGQALPPGSPFEIHIYPGAAHAFDNPMMPRTVAEGHVMAYDPAAAEDSYARVHAFLERWDAR